MTTQSAIIRTGSPGGESGPLADFFGGVIMTVIHFKTLNDPELWDCEEAIICVSTEEAKRAERIINKQIEYARLSGRRSGLEEAAKLVEMDHSLPTIASLIRALMEKKK